MPIVCWDDSFRTGIYQFDMEHQHLISLLNNAYDDFTAGAPRENMSRLLDELADYATYHFTNEELWMTQHSYADLDAHRNEHEMFVKRLKEMMKDYHGGKQNIALELLTFLTSWLKNHILKTDAGYGQLLQ